MPWICKLLKPPIRRDFQGFNEVTDRQPPNLRRIASCNNCCWKSSVSAWGVVDGFGSFHLYRNQMSRAEWDYMDSVVKPTRRSGQI